MLLYKYYVLNQTIGIRLRLFSLSMWYSKYPYIVIQDSLCKIPCGGSFLLHCYFLFNTGRVFWWVGFFFFFCNFFKACSWLSLGIYQHTVDAANSPFLHSPNLYLFIHLPFLAKAVSIPDYCVNSPRIFMEIVLAAFLINQ